MIGPTDDEVLVWFDSVPVHGPAVVKLDRIRETFKHTAMEILQLVPSCADRTTALRELAAASRTAVFAFTHNQET